MIDNFSSTTPAALTGYQLGKWQADPVLLDPSAKRNASVGVPNTGGVLNKTATYAGAASDCGLLITFNSSSAVTYTLPATPPFAQWTVRIVNVGSGALTVTPAFPSSLDSTVASVTLAQWEGLSLATDGSNYFSARGVLANVGTAGTYTKVTTDAKGRVISGTILVASDIPNIAESQVTNLVADLALLAPKASPALTGTPTVPTAASGTNTTQVASTAFVQAALGSMSTLSNAAAEATFDGQGSVPTVNSKFRIVAGFNATITSWQINADISGSAQVSITRNGTSINSTSPLVLTSANNASSSTLTGWTTSISRGDVLIFNLDSVSTCTVVTSTLLLTRTS